MVSGNVSNDLNDLDKLATMPFSLFLFFFTPSQHGVRWTRVQVVALGAGDVVFVICTPHRQPSQPWKEGGARIPSTLALGVFCTYLHLTVGVSDVLGIHIISNKSSKPHTEKILSGGLEKIVQFP